MTAILDNPFSIQGLLWRVIRKYVFFPVGRVHWHWCHWIGVVKVDYDLNNTAVRMISEVICNVSPKTHLNFNNYKPTVSITLIGFARHRRAWMKGDVCVCVCRLARQVCRACTCTRAARTMVLYHILTSSSKIVDGCLINYNSPFQVLLFHTRFSRRTIQFLDSQPARISFASLQHFRYSKCGPQIAHRCNPPQARAATGDRSITPH